MKSISTALGILSLILVAVLFYLHFTHKEELKKANVAADRQQGQNGFKIAYFDIDSLQSNYDYYKDALAQMKKKESAVNAELEGLRTRYQKRIAELQKKGPTMTQQEGEEAQQEVGQMDRNFRQREASLQEDLQNHQMKLVKDLRKEIEKYLAVYNKDREYAYIFSYEPGFIYYRDSIYDITGDLVKGLNAHYKNRAEKDK